LKVYNPRPKFSPARLPRRTPERVVPSQIGEAGQVGNWLFYNGAGDVLYDFSGAKNHGDIIGPKWIDGPFGWALEFDGEDDYVEAPSINMENEITISVWVYRKVDSGTWERLVAKSDSSDYDWWLQITKDDSIGGGFTDAGGTTHNDLDSATGTAVPLNQWTHLVFVYNGSEVLGYFNGNLDESASIGSYTIRTSARPTWIGRLLSSYNFSGIIDEVRIYDRALSESEIQNHFEATRVLYGA